MKKIYTLYIIVCLMTIAINSKAQDVKFGVYAGYARSLYGICDEHEGQCGFLPLAVSLSRVIEEDKLDIGIEARINLIKPAFALKHPLDGTKAYTNKFCGQYIEAFGKYYPIDLPVFGIAGAGVFVNNHKKTIYETSYYESEPWLKNDYKRVEKTAYKISFAFNIGFGVSFGSERKLDFTVRYHYHKNKLANDEEDLGYAAGDISFGLGYRF